MLIELSSFSDGPASAGSSGAKDAGANKTETSADARRYDTAMAYLRALTDGLGSVKSDARITAN
jgi:hypothetical protein